MWRLFVSILVVVTFLGARPSIDELDDAPALDVSVLPPRGAIPAKFANGRTVYVFRASVTKQRAEGQPVVILRAQRLLQAGMTEKLHAKSEELELRGAITMDAAGTARYRTTVMERGKTTLASSAHLVVRDGATSPRFGR
jgi:hypothetical protein